MQVFKFKLDIDSYQPSCTINATYGYERNKYWQEAIERMFDPEKQKVYEISQKLWKNNKIKKEDLEYTQYDLLPKILHLDSTLGLRWSELQWSDWFQKANYTNTIDELANQLNNETLSKELTEHIWQLFWTFGSCMCCPVSVTIQAESKLTDEEKTKCDYKWGKYYLTIIEREKHFSLFD